MTDIRGRKAYHFMSRSIGHENLVPRDDRGAPDTFEELVEIFEDTIEARAAFIAATENEGDFNYILQMIDGETGRALPIASLLYSCKDGEIYTVQPGRG